MQIIGFNISKISAERKNPVKDKLEIKSGLNVDNIAKEELEISKDSALKFDFSYNINYEPDIAEVSIKGTILTIDDKGEGKEILKDWKKKKFNSPIKIPLFNFIMDKCNIKALHLEEELGLPFHLPLPKLSPTPIESNQKINQEKPKANYAG